ncbi:acyl carrier protein [Shewanella sp.]|uniref:acyl carrier protein n=1 Tax=Shewanella sp. TaxID=50422 RepID=UPI001ECEA7F6|nr:acyl carrier protein [Shewanella sp.]NRB23459.1 acyl carrier protein [Shewanella sp.]
MLNTNLENEVVHTIVAEVLNKSVDDIDLNTKIINYGIDSIQVLDIIGRIRRYYELNDFRVDLANMTIAELDEKIINILSL